MACFCVQINNEVNIVETEQDNIEMSMRINTDIESEDTFYTDLNGFQVAKHRGKETPTNFFLFFVGGPVLLYGTAFLFKFYDVRFAKAKLAGNVIVINFKLYQK